ncbi:MAG: hypothetical protein AABW56_00825 [Nanoarchaeota archaeon]
MLKRYCNFCSKKYDLDKTKNSFCSAECFVNHQRELNKKRQIKFKGKE